MNKFTTLKSLFVLTAFSLSAGLASAADGKQCFEDGLKTTWSTPAKNIDLGHRGEHDHNSRDRFEDNYRHDEGHHGDKFAFEHNEHHFDDKDIGGGINVSPVPEPATDAMLLAGLVMLVTLARRKPKSLGAAISA